MPTLRGEGLNGTTDYMSCAGCEHCACQSEALELPREKESVWVKTAPAATYPQLMGDISVDVAIVGAGITGLLVAYELTKAGKKVAVLEGAEHLGFGVTGYTTAHLTAALDTRYHKLVRQFGQTKSRLVAQASQAAIEYLGTVVRELNIECDFKSVPGYLYTEDADQIDTLKQEAKAAADLGLPVEFTTEVPLPFKTLGAAKFNNQAQFHPLKFITGLAQAITARGGQIFINSRVTDCPGTKLVTAHGTVNAQDVVLATHTPITKKLLTVQAKLISHRSYVLGAKLKTATAVPDGLYWDTDEPYHYLRNQPTDQGVVTLIGGADHGQGEVIDTNEPFQKLVKYTEKRLAVDTMIYAWSAQLFMPADGLPYIGQAPGQSHLYVATGYMGNGFTFAPMAAKIIPELIAGTQSDLGKLLKPSRITVYSLGALAQAGWHNFSNSVLAKFKKTPTEKTDETESATARGSIQVIDGKKVAVYTDATGQVTKLSAVCTHAGCIVQWNAAETTWDCPCHGSRFKATGEVIEGPATKNLPAIS